MCPGDSLAASLLPVKNVPMREPFPQSPKTAGGCRPSFTRKSSLTFYQNSRHVVLSTTQPPSDVRPHSAYLNGLHASEVIDAVNQGWSDEGTSCKGILLVLSSVLKGPVARRADVSASQQAFRALPTGISHDVEAPTTASQTRGVMGLKKTRRSLRTGYSWRKELRNDGQEKGKGLNLLLRRRIRGIRLAALRIRRVRISPLRVRGGGLATLRIGHARRLLGLALRAALGLTCGLPAGSVPAARIGRRRGLGAGHGC